MTDDKNTPASTASASKDNGQVERPRFKRAFKNMFSSKPTAATLATPTVVEGSIGSLEGVVAREQNNRQTVVTGPRTTRPATERKQGYQVKRTRMPGADGARPPRRDRRDDTTPAATNDDGTPRTAAPRAPARPKSTIGKASGKLRRQMLGFPKPEVVRNVDAKSYDVGNVPPIKEKMLRIIPIGGQEEVGLNMTVFEYGDDIVIIDMGLQFPEEDMPGIDYIVPNVSYLRGKEQNIRGVIFTHGHMDHIGAAPILLRQLQYPTIVAKDFTLALIQRKVEDEEKGSAKKLKAIRVKSLNETIKLGIFEIRFFAVEHSIMDAMGIALVTPNGTIIHFGDWTITNEPIQERTKELDYTNLQSLPQPTFLMLESLGALKKGLPPSETEVHTNIQNLIRTAPGRLIIGTFASQIRRIAYLVDYAEKLGKKIALEGYSMKMCIEVAKELGFIKAKPDTFIDSKDIDKYPDKQIVVFCTGAQGESNAALSRIVTDTHKSIKLKRTDTILFSSSVIPGNERTIQRLKDNLYRRCDNVIHSEIMEIHIGGHGTIMEIEEILRQVKPQYVLPVYANHYFIMEAGRIAERMGWPKQNVFIMDNGHVLEVPAKETGAFPKMLDEKADTSHVFVDGLGIGDISHVVLRDRKMLAEDGMMVITILIDSRTKKLRGGVQITSRGFIHVKENFELVNQIKEKVQEVVHLTAVPGVALDWDMVRNTLRDEIGLFLFQKTERRPMVLPVVVEV